ncbi:MAG: hypothetical protein V1792_10070 [Pseudomonadota bacterium]
MIAIVLSFLSQIRSNGLDKVCHPHYFALLWPHIIDNKLLQKINGPAIKLYMWLLVQQEEPAQRNSLVMPLSDAVTLCVVAISKQSYSRRTKCSKVFLPLLCLKAYTNKHSSLEHLGV